MVTRQNSYFAFMSTKSTKKRLVACKERADKILNILNGKKGSVDITQFANTIKFVNGVFEDYVKSKDKERPVVPDEGVQAEKLLREYEELLIQLSSTGRFLRVFTSNRVRKKLDQLNTQLHKEASAIFLGLQEFRKKGSGKSISKSSSSKKGTLKAELEKERHTESIKDEEAKLFWENNFSQVRLHRYCALASVIADNGFTDLDDRMERVCRCASKGHSY